MIWFLFGIVCCSFLLVVFAYFKMNNLDKAVKLAYQKLDVATKDRAALIDSLIRAVREVEEIDPSKLQTLQDLRQVPLEWDARVDREDAITRCFKYIFTVTSDHPEMLLDATFEKLQNRIIQAEGNYRRNKNKYNTAVHSFYVFGELIPFNVIRHATEMQNPQYFSAYPNDAPEVNAPAPETKPQDVKAEQKDTPKTQKTEETAKEQTKPQAQEQKTAKAEQKSAQTEEKSKQAEQKPAQTEEKSKHVEQKPAQTEEKSEHVEQKPAQTEEKSEHVEQKPAQTEKKSEQAEQKPAQTEKQKSETPANNAAQPEKKQEQTDLQQDKNEQFN